MALKNKVQPGSCHTEQETHTVACPIHIGSFVIRAYPEYLLLCLLTNVVKQRNRAIRNNHWSRKLSPMFPEESFFYQPSKAARSYQYNQDLHSWLYTNTENLVLLR